MADSRFPRDGRVIEKIGFFNPVAQGGQERLRLDQARVEYWISKGAQPSDRVAKLIKTAVDTAVAA
ncbi:MAG TPA: 30S ribosomal protein S16 [Pseudomonadales bacterium]